VVRVVRRDDAGIALCVACFRLADANFMRGFPRGDAGCCGLVSFGLFLQMKPLWVDMRLCAL